MHEIKQNLIVANTGVPFKMIIAMKSSGGLRDLQTHSQGFSLCPASIGPCGGGENRGNKEKNSSIGKIKIK